MTIILDKDLLLKSAEITTLTNMTNALAKAHGIGVSIFGINQERIVGPSNHTEFCKLISNKSNLFKDGVTIGEHKCQSCDKKHFPSEGRTIGPYTCHAGLTDFSVPIVISDGTVIGAIFGGQVLRGQLNRRQRSAMRRRAKNYGIDEVEMLEAARDVEKKTLSEIKKVIKLMETIAATIAELVERRTHEHDFLLKLTSTLDLKNLTEYVIQYVELTLKADACSIFLHRIADGKEVFMLENTSSKCLAGDIAKAYYAKGEGLTGWIAAMGNPLLIHDVQDKNALAQIEKRYNSSLPLKWDGKHTEITNPKETLRYLGVPLFSSDGKTIGVIRAIRKKGQDEFTDTDRATLQGLALLLVNALESAEAQEKAKRKTADMALLREAAMSLNTSEGWREMLQSIIDKWFSVPGHDRTKTSLYVLQHSPERKKFTFLAGDGEGFNPAQIGAEFDDTEGLAGQVLMNKAPYVCQNVRKDRHYKEVLPGLRSAIVVPVTSGDQIVGTFSMGGFEENAFTDDDAELLEAFGKHVGIAFDTVRLYEQSRLPVEVMNEVVSKIGSATGVGGFVVTEKHKSVGEAIVEATKEKLKSEACSLFIVRQEKLQLLATTDSDLKKKLQEGEPVIYERGEGLTGSVAKLEKPIRVKDVTDSEEIRRIDPSIHWKKKHSERIEKTEGARAFLGIPIMFRDELIGVIRLSRPKYHSGFLPPEEEALKGIAQHAAVLLQFVQAITDKDSVIRAFAHDAGDPAADLLGEIRSYYSALTETDVESVFPMYSTAHHLAFLVQTYIDIGKNDDVAIKCDKLDECNIWDMIQIINAILEQRDIALAEKVHMDIRIPRDLCVKADEAMLHTIFYNVLKNAWVYCEKDIVIDYRENGKNIEFTITDDGPGIDPRNLHVLGRVGHQGLNIATMFARAHNGDLKVSNVNGGKRGAKATVILPRLDSRT